MGRHALNLLVLVLLGVILLTGMPGRSDAQGPAQLVIGETVDLSTLDPQKNTVITTETVLINIYDTLIRRDAQLRLQPGLAASWRNIDPTTWEFKLRQGVRFHNGESFNAETVKFSFDRGLDPKTRWSRAGAMKLVKSVTVMDPMTIRITTERPWALLLQSLARHGWIVPRQYLQQNGDDALLRQPLGTGPYKFVRWVKDDRVELVANADYWGGKPRIGRVLFRLIPTEATRLSELLAGSVHLNRRLPPEHFEPIEHSRRLELVEGPSISISHIFFFLKDKPKDHPLMDKRVRQAINYAVDRTAMLQTIMRGKGKTIATFCTEVMFGCDPSIQPFAYDPERARALLREAGYANGFDMTIVSTEGRYVGDRDITLAVVEQLKQVGIRARPLVMEHGLWLKQLLERKYEGGDASYLTSTGLLGHAGADIAGQVFISDGFISFWSNREFDQLLQTAESTIDEARAKDLLRRAQVLFKEEAPSVPLYLVVNAAGVRKGLRWTPSADIMLKVFDMSWAQ